MIPKEKAIELINKISECAEDGTMYIETAKRIANVFIDNMLLNSTPKQKTHWKIIRYEIENYNYE
jgi:hypothetical protein